MEISDFLRKREPLPTLPGDYKENAEWEHIEDEEWRHPMAGSGIYMTNKRNRAERKRLHKEQLAAIS